MAAWYREFFASLRPRSRPTLEFRLFERMQPQLSPEDYAEEKTTATPVASPDQQEGALIQRVLGGEHDAFYVLIQPYQRPVFMAALSILNNPADAEETAQEAFLRAFRALANFRADCKFSTWLIQIAINEARSRLRKEHRNLYESIDQGVEAEDGDYIPRDFADWREIPTETLQRAELRQALARALATLAPIYRQVLVMRDVNHMSIQETADALGISAANVKTRLLRARLQMRDALAPGFDGSWITGSSEYKKVRPW